MDIMQKQDPRDRLRLSAQSRHQPGKVMWVDRARFHRIPAQNIEKFNIEVVETAAYGTEEWKVANEAALP